MHAGSNRGLSGEQGPGQSGKCHRALDWAVATSAFIQRSAIIDKPM